MTKTQTEFDKMAKKSILARRKQVLKIINKFEKYNKGDRYWKNEKETNIERNVIINWIGSKFKPKKILEIGTRAGGSLVSLMSAYDSSKCEVFCFDLWREYHNILRYPFRVFAWLLPRYIRKKLSINLVKRNLKLFNISSKNINFISGDSKITVPDFFKKHPNKEFDYVLVDGGHDKLTAFTDLKNVGNHITNGGIIIFDDIYGGYNLITEWDKFKEIYKNKFDFYEHCFKNLGDRWGVGWAIKRKTVI